jgi:hypothetical protein
MMTIAYLNSRRESTSEEKQPTKLTAAPTNACKQTYLLPISNGIIEHRQKIGSAIWLFMLLIDWTTSEENGVGKVLGGKPVKLRDLMEALHLKERQVSSQLRRLQAESYIRLRRTSYGYSIEVMKSKKFINRDRQKVADHGQHKTADHIVEIGNNLPNRSAISRRNKEDITLDLTNKEREVTESDKLIPDSLSCHPKEKRTRAAAASDPRVKVFLTCFAEEYEKRQGVPYAVRWGKEGKLVKEILAVFDLPRLKDLAVRFLESSDPWVLQYGGFTIGVFISQINKLASTGKGTAKPPKVKDLGNDWLEVDGMKISRKDYERRWKTT